ncbi:SnoaL-like domain-containing protein [Nitrosomonas cryotolerans]|uniref:SnoaL-like domain-containing protein n=2 Tax=Nitrosomonas cryotolerans TaxID=44575 RepID=A0A1N6GQJ9_9PROT|nr:SnoaL-like domain-containing protein [Nitrosomonas cryotolerans]SIO09778.1 SnoaL-like domain-containing protein [Nitrosomonas cryotolerans ATCC 49181]
MIKMNAAKCVDLAKTYVALSNSHNLQHIALMFIDEATYHSSYSGELKGSPAINEMMVSFFSRFPDVHWDVPEYRITGDLSVEFEFTMNATDATSRKRVERRGLEQINFTADGLISHIAVHKPNKE